MKIVFAFILGLFLTQNLTAQDTLFSVVAVNGTSMIQRGSNPDEFVKVAPGILVFDNDKIVVTGSDSYIGLVSPIGKVTEITKGGVFTAEDLVANLVNGDAILANTYTNLFAQNLTAIKYDQAQYNMFTGISVDRSSNEIGIEIFLPAKTKISDNSAIISWSSKKSIENYKVSMTNLYEEVVFSAATSDTKMLIDFASIDLSPGHVYRFTVFEVGNVTNKSADITLQVPTRSDLAKYQTDLKMLQEEIPKNSAIGDMVMATYLQEQGLFLQAIPYFKSAIEKEPKIVEYKHAYDVFLYKVGLEK